MFDGKLIAIPPADTLDEKSLCEQCRAVEGGGATAIQLRLKAVSAGEFMRRTEALLRCVEVPVYVNDRADVAIVSGAAGVHLGADDLPLVEARRIVRPPMKLGVSVGTIEEARRSLPARADYWSFGPFFSTSTKLDAGPPIGAVGFQRLKSIAPPEIPCVAIGGITYVGLDDVVAAGAVGVAVVSAIFHADNVETATRQMRDRLDALVSA